MLSIKLSVVPAYYYPEFRDFEMDLSLRMQHPFPILFPANLRFFSELMQILLNHFIFSNIAFLEKSLHQ